MQNMRGHVRLTASVIFQLQLCHSITLTFHFLPIPLFTITVQTTGLQSRMSPTPFEITVTFLQDSVDGSPSEPHPYQVLKSASSSSIPSQMSRRSLLGTTEGGNTETQHMDQDTVLALTHDVRTFSDSLSRLHNVIHKRDGKNYTRSMVLPRQWFTVPLCDLGTFPRTQTKSLPLLLGNLALDTS